MPFGHTIKPKNDHGWNAQPALKVCMTTGLSKKDVEKAGTIIRHAITKVMIRRASVKLGVPTP